MSAYYTEESSVPLIVDMFMCDSMVGEVSLIHSDLMEKVISMTGTAEDWQWRKRQQIAQMAKRPTALARGAGSHLDH